MGLGPPPDAEAAGRGEQLFARNCAFCHGAKANGAEGPDLIRSAVVLHDEKGETIGQVVLKGRPERGMPAFPFTSAQVYDIAEFLHMRVELTANRGTYQTLNIVTGNAKAGEAYFASHCASCHSASGDLAHVAGKYQPPELQSAFLYPSSKAHAPVKVTVSLPSGQSVTGNLKRMDDFTVSMNDSNGDYHAWPIDTVKVNIEDPLAGHRELLDKYSDTDMHNILAYLVTFK